MTRKEIEEAQNINLKELSLDELTQLEIDIGVERLVRRQRDSNKKAMMDVV